MNLDAFSISALADEFRVEIMGGRVQQITQITPLTFGLEIYAQQKRQYLLISAEPSAPRVHLQPQKPRRGDTPPAPIFQLLRKYLRGSLLLTIEQPPFERVLLFHFSGKQGDSTLVVELMGTRSNLIFLDETGRILAIVRPAPTKSERSRPLLPNHPYTLPHGQQKITPDALSSERLSAILQTAPPDVPLHKTLVRHLAGMSPLIAREIVFRATDDTATTVAAIVDPTALLETIRLVYRHVTDHAWQPHAVFSQANAVELFAPIALTHHPRAEPVESMSAAVAAHFNRADAPAADGYFAARLPVRQRIQAQLEKLSRRQKRLAEDAARLENPDIFKEMGNAILANSWQIAPRQKILSVAWTDGEPLEITLDPALSPAENAQRYFSRYQKAKRAAEIIPEQQTVVARQIDYLRQLLFDLETAESRPEIDAVAASLSAVTGDTTRQRTKKSKKAVSSGQPRRYVSPDGFSVWVGKNAIQNHRLTFERAAPNDIWLHARGVPGAHVVISTAEGEPPKRTIEWAAGVAAYFSKNRGEPQVDVIVTRKKYVRAIKGAPPGLVSVRQEKTVRVSPVQPETVER